MRRRCDFPCPLGHQVRATPFPYMLCQTSDSDVFDLPPPPHAHYTPRSLAALLLCSTSTLSPLPLYPFIHFSFSAISSLTFRQSLPLVLADASTATFNKPGPPPLVLAEAAAAAVFAPAPLPLVLAEPADEKSSKTGMHLL